MVSKLNYDDLLQHIGTFGSYQIRNFILLCIPVILCAFHKLSSVFILGKMNHRCQLYENDINFQLSNDTAVLNDILRRSYPFDKKKYVFSKCEYFTDNYYTVDADDVVNYTQHHAEKCSTFVWDHDKFQSSAVETFELICEKDHYKAASDSLFMIGVFLGSFSFGYLSDKFGRRKVFVLSLICQLIFGFLTALSTEFMSFTIFRMVGTQIKIYFIFSLAHSYGTRVQF